MYVPGLKRFNERTACRNDPESDLTTLCRSIWLQYYMRLFKMNLNRLDVCINYLLLDLQLKIASLRDNFTDAVDLAMF